MRRVGIVLGLGEHVGGEEASDRLPAAMIRISVGPATKSMPTSPASSFLGGGHVDVAGADDAVGLGTVSVPKAKAAMAARHPCETHGRGPECRGAEDFVDWVAGRRRRFLHARDLGRNGRHDQRGGQGIAAGRDVGADGVERPDDLAQVKASAELNAVNSRGSCFSAKSRTLRGGDFHAARNSGVS